MMNTVIQKISARQVLDCKARPMLEVDVFTQDGSMGRGAAPTGTSVGAHGAFVLGDYDLHEFNGLSVHKAVNTVETVIAPALLGMDAADQRAIDQRMLELDGTENKERLGGNSIYSVSIACLRAAAAGLPAGGVGRAVGGGGRVLDPRRQIGADDGVPGHHHPGLRHHHLDGPAL